MREGTRISVRGASTTERLGRSIELQNPLERCITVPGRHNSISAAIAESVWVLAGRDDIEFLLPYLPRAGDFSDDGRTWRGAYGPRLRRWQAVDQLDEVRRLLQRDPASRRGVIELFDPARDFEETRDVPCNNWLHFLLRDGRLDLHIATRSNDVWWGFSGINTFEWSLLHEALAHWLSVDVGVQRYFISSLHLYERHYGQAEQVVGSAPATTEYSKDSSSSWGTPWDDLTETLSRWFEIEHDLRSGRDASLDIESFADPLLRDMLRVLRATWAEWQGADPTSVSQHLEKVHAADLRWAAEADIARLRRAAARPQ